MRKIRVVVSHLVFFMMAISSWAPEAVSMPNRVITLAPNLAEWVAEIVGKDEALKHLVAVSEYSE